MAQTVGATTYYIDDAGSDAAAGTSSAAPWKTWTKAFGASTVCGDTVIVMDGTYTASANGNFVITKVCTVSTVFTVQAQNERMAFIDGSTGTFTPIMIGSTGASGQTGAAYITIEGIRARSGDLAPSSGGTNFGPCNVYHATHITFRHMICSHPNRYRNAGHVYQFVWVTNSLIEESEAYYFHRHAFFLGNSDDNVVRRNYCNGRGYADLSGTGVESPSTGPSTDHADDCFIAYPGSRNIFENNIAEGDMLKCYALEALNNTTDSNQFLGNICTGGAWNGISLDARGSTASQMPRNTVIENMYIEDTNAHGISGQTASTYRFNGNYNTRCTNCTANNAVDNFLVNRLAAQPGDGIYSVTFENSLSLNAQRAQTTGTYSTTTGYGFYIDPIIGTWAATNNNAYNSFKANYSPATSANYSPNPNSAIDPQMGACKVWQPDGSNAKTNNWGANILYRYEDGILTTTPLWDPTTGEFPHAAVITGVNDIDGSSPYNVHVRLNVNTGGCSFPSGFSTGGGPTDPSTHHTASGTGAISVSFTVPAGLDFLGAFILLRDGGMNVGTVTAVSSSCGGGESFTFQGRAKNNNTTPLHNMEGWTLHNPTSGTCTISATTTGTVGSWIIDVFEHDNSSAFGTVAGNGATSGSTPTVTISTNTGETIYAATSGSSAATTTAGADQTLLVDLSLAPMKMAVSSQSGTDGGVMDYIMGSSANWAILAMSFQPTVPDPPSTATLTLSKYRLYKPYGTESGAIAKAAQDTSAIVVTNAVLRIRAEIVAGTATSDPFGPALYCRKNGGSYTVVTNTVGTHGVRLYGGGTSPDLPSSGTATTQRFSGTYTAGALLRDASTSFTVPAMASGTRTELEYVIALSLADDDVVNCQIRQNDGTQLDTYTVTPTITANTQRLSSGF